MTQVTVSEGRRKLIVFEQYKDAVSNSWANILLLSFYNPLCVFDYSTRSCQAHLSITTSVQFFTLNTLISFRTSSHHLFLGCPLDLFPIGLHSKNPPYHSILLHPMYVAPPFQSFGCYEPQHVSSTN